MNTIKIEKGNVKMVAHAGLAGLERANTLAGVIAAGNRSYFGIEVDVRITKDNQVVLVHNESVWGPEGEEIFISKSTLDDLQKIVFSDRIHFYDMEKYGIDPLWGEKRSDLRISTLDEYIRLCKKYEKIAFLELKSDMTQENVADIVNQFKAQDYLDGALFISFNWESLDAVKKLLPNQRVQLITDMETEFSDEFLDRVADAGFDLDLHIFKTTKELVERVHARGMEVNVWTCDWPDRAARLVEWGVDYITSNILE